VLWEELIPLIGVDSSLEEFTLISSKIWQSVLNELSVFPGLIVGWLHSDGHGVDLAREGRCSLYFVTWHNLIISEFLTSEVSRDMNRCMDIVSHLEHHLRNLLR